MHDASSHRESGAQPLDPRDLETLRPTLTRVARIAKALFGASAADVLLFSEGQLWRASDAIGAFSDTDPASEIVAHSQEVVWIENLTADPRFAHHPTVTGEMALRLYAGAPIQLQDGRRIGALAIYDQTPRALDQKLAARLADLAAIVANDFDRVQAIRERAQAQQQIERSEERFRVAIESAGLYVYEMDYVARTFSSAGAEDTFYLRPRTYEELAADPWCGIHADDREGALQQWRQIEGQQKRWTYEARVWREDDKEIWARFTSQLVFEGDNPVRLIGTMQNITDRKHDETALHNAKAQTETNNLRLAFALDTAKAAAWEIDITNQALIGGDEYGRICGRTISADDVRAMNELMVHPDDKAVMLTFTSALTSGEQQDVEYRIVRTDGTIAWVRTSGRGFTNNDGERRLVLLTTDITERKRTEHEFSQAMRQAAAALRAKRSLVAAIARDVGVAPDADVSPRDETQSAISLSEAASFAELYERLAALLSEIDTRDQALVTAVGSLRDARAAAEGANVAKSQFLATMSHELRTPLNAVIGYAEILEEDLRADAKEEGAADAARISKAARSLLLLINEVLDFSKIEAGRMEIKWAPANVPAILDGVLETVRHLAEANENTIEVALDPAIGDVVTDEARLRQCLLNLVSNACKFTREGSVLVRGRLEGRTLVFDVADTGAGIEADQAKRLFQPFVQADSTHTRVQGGTGLGLVITRKLAELMGGDVSFVSAPGAGSTFTLRVSAPAIIDQISDTGEGQVVVVIEDDHSARDLAHRALAHLPFRVRSASTGADGLKLISEIEPDLIVLDIHLPDCSGWDLLARLKGDPDLCVVPVMVLTVDDDRARAMNMGACEHLEKPVDRERFAAAALRHVRMREIDAA